MVIVIAVMGLKSVEDGYTFCTFPNDVTVALGFTFSKGPTLVLPMTVTHKGDSMQVIFFSHRFGQS